MQATSVHFSSKTDLWETPAAFFEQLNKEFCFTLDVCALPDNAKVSRFFTPELNALQQEWTGVCWMNPPYGRVIRQFVEKAYQSAKMGGATVVCLLPARTDTSWWHDFVVHGEVRFVRGRLKFGQAANSAPFPSAIVVFRPGIL